MGDAWDLYFKGLDLENEKEHKGAAKYYEEAIKNGCNMDHAFKRLAIFYRNQTDFENEIRIIRHAIKSILLIPSIKKNDPVLAYYKRRLEKAKKLCPDDLLDKIGSEEEPVEKDEFQEIHMDAINVRKKKKKGGKAIYIHNDGSEFLIEQLAMQAYEQNGYKAFWTENNFWWQIMMLLYWDILLSDNNEFDVLSDPRGFHDSEFYRRIKSRVKAQNNSMRKSKLFGLIPEGAAHVIKSNYSKKNIANCSYFYQVQPVPLNDYLTVINALPLDDLERIIDRILSDFFEYRRGLPDLTLVKGGKIKFAEVKAPKEKVMDHQIYWHRFLRSECNLEVDIIRVFTEND